MIYIISLEEIYDNIDDRNVSEKPLIWIYGTNIVHHAWFAMPHHFVGMDQKFGMLVVR